MKNLKKIQSSTLLYTVLVAFIIFIILLSFIQISYISTKFLDREILKDKLEANIKSCLEVLLQRKELLFQDEINLYRDNSGKVFIKTEFHGAYQIINLSASISKINLEKKYLVGTANEPDNFAIILPERNNELTLSGNTIIKGNCILPKLGVKQGMVNGVSFVGDRLIDGNISKSSNSIPNYNKRLLNLKEEYLKDDSIILYSEIEGEQEIIRRFIDKKQIIYSTDLISISNKLIAGNVVVISEKGIMVNEQTKLKDIILIAPFINIGKNLQGNFQAFARDSVIIKEDVRLDYPSFIGVFPVSNQTKTKIVLNQNAVVAGTVLGLNQTQLTIEDNAKIFGAAYIQGITELKGKVLGSILTERFSLKTGLNEHRDVIQNGEINIHKRPSLLANAFIFEDFQSIKVIKELD